MTPPGAGAIQPPPPSGGPPAPYSVGQVAELLGVQQAFLRRLEQFELVEPARSPGQQRRYSRGDVQRVEQVMGLVGEGLTLEGIRRILALQAEVAELKAELADLRAR